ncbi:MAG TPA: PilZ domain-containing protein, partial [Saprospiraceae bacterium]|nr:PilZ domain-containing protein [Saprospiraceae bacterium]
MKDNRRYKRYTLDMMEVNGSMLRATDMTIIDIGLGGICIKSDRRLNIGTEYALKLTDKSNVLVLKGTVMWSFLIGSRETAGGERIPIYQAGMEVTNSEEGEMHALLGFIERNRAHEFAVPKGRRINVGVHIKAQDEAILYSNEKYKVRQISLGGMRIDSAYSMEIDSTILMELFPPGNSTINFVGRVASVNPNSQDSYSVGIEFLDMTEGD